MDLQEVLSFMAIGIYHLLSFLLTLYQFIGLNCTVLMGYRILVLAFLLLSRFDIVLNQFYLDLTNILEEVKI